MNQFRNNVNNNLAFDDFRVTERPWWFSQFWNYDTCLPLQLLSKQAEANRLPRMMAFIGDYSSGKTSAALCLGAWTNCDSKDQSVVPCGQCDGCRLTRTMNEWHRSGMVLIDGTASDVEKSLHDSVGIQFHRKLNGRDERPYIFIIEEAHRMPLAS